MGSRDRAEFAAIPLVVVLLGGIFLVLLAAYLGAGWLLVGIPVVIVAALLAWGLASRRRPSSDSAPPARATPAADDVYRVLVIADADSGSPALRELIARHAGNRKAAALVVAPALSSRLARWTGDEGAYEAAGQHLEATLAALSDAHIEARGHVGPHDPIQAADDGLREFPADELVFATSGAGENWSEANLLETARERYDLPVAHVDVDAPPAA
jgi:hypothetical protein